MVVDPWWTGNHMVEDLKQVRLKQENGQFDAIQGKRRGP